MAGRRCHDGGGRPRHDRTDPVSEVFAMHEALSAVTYQVSGVIQLYGWPWVVQNQGTQNSLLSAPLTVYQIDSSLLVASH